MPRQTFKIEWDAHEYEHKERTPDWFWAMGIITFSLAVVAIILGNIIFGILILLAAFSLSLFINRPPENIHILVDERGITKDKIHYPYSTLESFWIDEDHPHKKIIIRSKKLLMPLIIIPIGDDLNLDKLHETLLMYMHEEYHALPFVEKILEYLGF
jgi:hypothetical protein